LSRSFEMAGEIPLILTLDNHGVPHRWVTWQQACFYYAKNLVAWTLGEAEVTFHGGISQATGKRSSITPRSIIAITGKAIAPPRAPNHRDKGKGSGEAPLHPGPAPQQPGAFPPRPPHLRLLRRRVQLPAPDARPHSSRVPRRDRHLDERGHGVPLVQRREAQ